MRFNITKTCFQTLLKLFIKILVADLDIPFHCLNLAPVKVSLAIS